MLTQKKRLSLEFVRDKGGAMVYNGSRLFIPATRHSNYG